MCAPQNHYSIQNERKVMNDKFDELAKNMAQSLTRRAALKKFGVALAGVVLGSFGLTNNSEAHQRKRCGPHGNCPKCYDCGIDGFCYFVCY